MTSPTDQLLLEATDLTVRFGGLCANDSISLTVPSDAIVGLIGPNGAGKTTFIDVVTGFTRHQAGTVMFDGRDLEGLRPHERALLGLSRTFQSVELFDDLTVGDNLAIGSRRPRWFHPLVDMVHPSGSPRDRDGARWALDVLELHDVADRYPGELPNGRRKIVGVARALAARPRLLLLDEPAAGLDSAESMVLGRDLLKLPAVGTSLLLVDHDMSLVMAVCSYIYVIDFGRIIAQGSPQQVRQDQAVIDAYLGSGGTSHVPVDDLVIDVGEGAPA